MKRKKKISTDTKMKQIVSTVLLLAVAVLVMFSIHRKATDFISVGTIEIDELVGKKRLITKGNVVQAIENRLGFSLKEARINDLDLAGIEKLIQKDPRVKQVEVYVDKKQKLFISIEQYKPILRVNAANGENYYISQKGTRIPLVEGTTVRVPLVTGEIDAFDYSYAKNKNHNLNEMYRLVKRIREDKFLNSLVDQIHLDKGKNIILIPNLGKKKIILGTMESLEDKLVNLKTYYKQGVKQVGVDKFSVLDLRFKNQVVGRT